MDIEKLSPEEKRALLERMLRAGRNTVPVKMEEHGTFKALRSRLAVVSKWTNIHPFFKAQQGLTRDTTRINGREFLNFSTYNYLGLSGDPRVSAAAKEAIDRYGTSPSASRIATGEKELHRELEAALASWLGAEAALVLVSGHATNVTVIGHLFNRRDLILYDSLAHNSIVQGVTLSGARARPFRHNDLEHLRSLLQEHRGEAERALIVTEGVFSMDGDIPDLPKLIEIKREFNAFLMVDEAHSLGVLGATGRGIQEHFGVKSSDVDIWMGTLSKSLASCGGYIAGSSELIRYLKYTTPGFIFSVGLTPPNTAAALAALQIMASEPERVTRLQHNARFFLAQAQAAGLDTYLAMGTPILPVVTGSSFRALKLSDTLHRRGINVDPVISPAVEQDKARLRFFVSSQHTEEQIRQAVQAMVEEIAKLPSRTTVIGETLSTLPSRDLPDLPSGRICDPGLVFQRRAKLVDPLSGEREKHFDPEKEDANAVAARAFYKRFGAGEGVDASLLDASLVVEVPGVEGQAAAGRWQGRTAFQDYLQHQRKVRPAEKWTVDYVMAYGDDLSIGGRRTLPVGEEWYLHLLTMKGGKIVRVEEVLDGGAWRGEGAPGPEAASLLVHHDATQAKENGQLMRDLYEAWVRKADIEKFIVRCAPDVVWKINGPKQLPFAGEWRGLDAVLMFWQDLAAIMDFHEFWIDALISRGDQVFSLGGFRSTAIPTNIAYSDPFLQVGTYRQGRLQHFIDYLDPRIDLAAYRPDVYE
uniref:8-amino-7-oxononanoate synthase n=1 Tax=Hyalangium minutum TaxID=394096 RepID=A0A1P8VQ23_9BACT|nr:8-amino-7-oxononanoate synthase [Hyalangium minutum]